MGRSLKIVQESLNVPSKTHLAQPAWTAREESRGSVSLAGCARRSFLRRNDQPDPGDLDNLAALVRGLIARDDRAAARMRTRGIDLDDFAVDVQHVAPAWSGAAIRARRCVRSDLRRRAGRRRREAASSTPRCASRWRRDRRTACPSRARRRDGRAAGRTPTLSRRSCRRRLRWCRWRSAGRPRAPRDGRGGPLLAGRGRHRRLHRYIVHHAFAGAADGMAVGLSPERAPRPMNRLRRSATTHSTPDVRKAGA